MKKIYKFIFGLVLIMTLTGINVFAQTTKPSWFAGGNTDGELTINSTITPNFGTLENQPINFYTNNLQRMVLTKDGNLGIGIKIPKSTLHLHNESLFDPGGTVDPGGSGGTTGKGGPVPLAKYAYNNLQITNKNTGMDATDGLILGVVDNAGFINLQEKSNLQLSTSGGTYLTLYKEGTVGIATSITEAKLDIYADKINGLCLITRENPNGYGYLSKVYENTTKAFVVSNLQNETFAVLGDGKTGIGTNNPTDMLQIGDGIKSLCLGIAYAASFGWKEGYIGFNAKRTRNDNMYASSNWTIASDGINCGGAVITCDVTGAVHIIAVKSSNHNGITLNDNDMRKYDVVTILAGELNQATNCLNKAAMLVNGEIKSKEVTVTLDGWCAPDYVFDDTYKLMSLQELEQFVKANKHLPEVPSANEVEENGIKVGEMNNTLLKKIEELTLYVIELNKKQELLERENNSLKERMLKIENK